MTNVLDMIANSSSGLGSGGFLGTAMPAVKALLGKLPQTPSMPSMEPESTMYGRRPTPGFGDMTFESAAGGFGVDPFNAATSNPVMFDRPPAAPPASPPPDAMDQGRPGRSKELRAAADQALAKYLSLIQADPGMGGQATPAVTLPKLPGWLLALMTLLSVSDPSQQTGPAIVNGLMQGGQMRSEQIERQRQMDAAQQNAMRQGALAAAEMEYKAAANAAAAAEEREQQLELEGLRQQGRINVAMVNRLRDVPAESRMSWAAAFGREGIEALNYLTEQEKLTAAKTGDIVRTQPSRIQLNESRARQAGSTADLNVVKGNDIIATQPSRIAENTASAASKTAYADLTKAKKAGELIKNKYADRTYEAKLASIEAETAQKKADAAKKIAETASIKSGKGADGKPITDTAAINNWRLIAEKKIDAEATARTNQASIDFWKLRETQLRNGSVKPEVKQGEDPNTAMARELREAADNVEYNKKMREVAKENAKAYENQLKEFEGKVATSQSGGSPTTSGKATPEWYKKAIQQVQTMLNNKQIDQAEANKRWRAIKKEAGVE